jgi:hypothetical protein
MRYHYILVTFAIASLSIMNAAPVPADAALPNESPEGTANDVPLLSAMISFDSESTATEESNLNFDFDEDLEFINSFNSENDAVFDMSDVDMSFLSSSKEGNGDTDSLQYSVEDDDTVKTSNRRKMQ